MKRSSNIESIPVERIHQEAVLVDGRKYFGQFDRLVDTGSKTSFLEFNPGQPQVSIVVATMERDERFKETVTRIMSAIGNLKQSSRLVIMDNSIRSDMEQQVASWVRSSANDAVESVVYHHDPRMTQTTGRNIAVDSFIETSESVILWDGDIYCHPLALESVSEAWSAYPSLFAMAPVMAGYVAGEIDHRISEFSDVAENPETRRRTHMPGKIGEEIGLREDNLMMLSMMRGCFWVKRSLIDAVAAINPDKKPWLIDFISMNNVPFFIAAKELGYDLAYLLDQRAVVVHDDRIDELSVGFKLPMREAQTLMEIVALMVRNKVYTPESNSVNGRFLDFNLSEISRVTNSDKSSAVKIQDYLLEIANILDNSADKDDFKSMYRSVRETLEEEVAKICDKVMSSICSGDTYSRIRMLKSPKPLRMIYSV